MNDFPANFVWMIRRVPGYLEDRLRELGVDPTPELAASIRSYGTPGRESEAGSASDADGAVGRLVMRVYALCEDGSRQRRAQIAAVPQDRIVKALTRDGTVAITAAFVIGHALYVMHPGDRLGRIRLPDWLLHEACIKYLADQQAWYATEEEAVRAGRLRPAPTDAPPADE